MQTPDNSFMFKTTSFKTTSFKTTSFKTTSFSMQTAFMQTALMQTALKSALLTAFSFVFMLSANAQESKTEETKGKFSGNAQLNYNFYDRDSTIGATGLLYDHAKSGGEGWVNLSYSQGTFEVGTRLDLFQNSQLHIPGSPYSGQGIGLIYVKKQINNLTLTAGNFYEQFGSGVALRAYEDRALGIDNALFGLRGSYKLSDRWQLKALAAVQKDLFKFYSPTVKAANIEGSFGFKDSVKAAAESLVFMPGVSIVNRTLDETTMSDLVSNINTLDLAKRFVPTYNEYVFQGYNTIQYKSFSLYTEYDYKTQEAIRDVQGNLMSKSGSVLFGTVGYSKKRFWYQCAVQTHRKLLESHYAKRIALDGRQINARLFAADKPPKLAPLTGSLCCRFAGNK